MCEVQMPRSWLYAAMKYAIPSIALAFVSITITGFLFGVSNNLFHIAYVLRLSESQEFAGDAFYASLRNFASIIWPILRIVSNESNVESVFYISNFISRTAAFAGLLFLIKSNGLTTTAGLVVCMAALAITPWLQGISILGAHGMFIKYFTHSEVTWPFVFLSLTLYSLKRLPLASAMVGLTFSINAFVGIWLFIANIVALRIAKETISSATSLKSICAFLLFASPVLIWMVLTTGGAAESVNLNYIDYIRQYYPIHFLIESAELEHLGIFAAVFVSGVLASQYLPQQKYWISVQAAFLLIFLLGIPLPYLVDNRFVFNLHLLRSTGIEQAIAIVLSITAGTILALNAADYRSRLLGAAVLSSIALIDIGWGGLIVIPLALLIGIGVGHGAKVDNQSTIRDLVNRYAGVLTWACVLLFVAAVIRRLLRHGVGIVQISILLAVASIFLLALWKNLSGRVRASLLAAIFIIYMVVLTARSMQWHANGRQNEGEAVSGQDKSWTELVDWIRLSDIHGVFLVPVSADRSSGTNMRSSEFQLNARRKVWVDWKQGAAVMWSPSFYNEWSSRYREVSTLASPDEYIAYARAHSISNVIIESNGRECPSSSFLIRATENYVLCGVNSARFN